MRLVKRINDIANEYDLTHGEVSDIYNKVILRSFESYVKKQNPDNLFTLNDYVKNGIREESLNITKRYIRRYKQW